MQSQPLGAWELGLTTSHRVKASMFLLVAGPIFMFVARVHKFSLIVICMQVIMMLLVRLV